MDEEFGSESDEDDMMIGDVGAMVKGIGAPAANGGRLSLFAMSRPDDAPVPKIRSKASRSILDMDDHDTTNYEALAKSSPLKTTKSDDLDEFLSDDDLPATKPAAKPTQTAASKAKAPLSVVPAQVKKRGRPAGSKNKSKDDDAPAPAPKAKAKAKTALTATKAQAKSTALSPAAKAYAAKKAKTTTRKQVSDDDEEDDIVDEPSSPPAAKPRGRPGRAAAAKAKPIYIDDDEDEESDAFDMDEDSD
jgi:DNA topoisomerase-2